MQYSPSYNQFFRYHLDCLSPPLTTVPADEWYCMECEPRHREQSSTTQQNEASSGNVKALRNTNNIRGTIRPWLAESLIIIQRTHH